MRPPDLLVLLQRGSQWQRDGAWVGPGRSLEFPPCRDGGTGRLTRAIAPMKSPLAEGGSLMERHDIDAGTAPMCRSCSTSTSAAHLA